MELPRAVLFDLDGTIVDNTDVIVDIYKRGLLALGINPPGEEQIAKLGGMSTFDTAKALGVPEEKRAFIDRFFWEESTLIFSTSFATRFSPKLIPGIHDLLGTLHSCGIPIGLVTSNTKENAESILKATNLYSYFLTLIGKDQVKEMKPSPEPVHIAVRKLGLDSTSGVWYVGDSPSDMIASKSAGAFSILLGEGKVSSDLKVSDHREIVEILQKIISGLSLQESV